MVMLWIRNRGTPLKTEFRLVVFKAEKILYDRLLTENNYAEFSLGDYDYTCRAEGAWIIPLGIGDKWINRIGQRYLHLYRIPKDKKGADKEPELIDRAIEPQNSSLILWKVKKYRGVKQGVEDQFKEPRGFDLPNWALIIVVLALLAAGVVMLRQLGYI